MIRFAQRQSDGEASSLPSFPAAFPRSRSPDKGVWCGVCKQSAGIKELKVRFPMCDEGADGLPWPLGRDPNSSVLRRDVESDRLIGNVSVTYVTLVPWRRERRRHVPSPRLLYHRWAAGPRLGSSAKTWICAAPAAYLCSRCDQRQLDAIIVCQCALARLVYTRSGLVSLSDIPIRRSSDVTSPFPPSGNEGYIRNWDVIVLTCWGCFQFV